MDGLIDPRTQLTDFTDAPHQIVGVRTFMESGILEAHLDVSADRLTDELNNQTSMTMREVSVLDLNTLVRYSAPQIAVPRTEVRLVHGSGPRGNMRQRFRTWPHAVTLIVGRYRVEGSIHTVPGGNATTGFYHRSVMVPITDAVVSYVLLGRVIEESFDLVIVNREAVTSMVATRDTIRDVSFPQLLRPLSEERTVVTPQYLPRPPRRLPG